MNLLNNYNYILLLVWKAKRGLQPASWSSYPERVEQETDRIHSSTGVPNIYCVVLVMDIQQYITESKVRRRT
ncbi:hypothetical protein NQ315_012728 [Exocentrus adspersus]|uniref:Uncharacterized protein n=1 Tax=Exocentrus adspersus TaxID=1586481 RepID=A0AAV8VF55_9CUCU|nr:hypothetical protein NQ315_012728 [Exocentrus adspersus]